MVKLFGRLLIPALALLAAGCATTAELTAPPGGELIRYATMPPGPICEPCESLELLVTSDGAVTIRESHTVRVHEGYNAESGRKWITRTRRTRIAPDVYVRFRERLQPYRRNGNVGADEQGCMSDSDVVAVDWIGGGPPTRLTYDFGCDPRGAEARAIATAPSLLGLSWLRNPLAPR